MNILDQQCIYAGGRQDALRIDISCRELRSRGKVPRSCHRTITREQIILAGVKLASIRIRTRRFNFWQDVHGRGFFAIRGGFNIRWLESKEYAGDSLDVERISTWRGGRARVYKTMPVRRCKTKRRHPSERRLVSPSLSNSESPLQPHRSAAQGMSLAVLPRSGISYLLSSNGGVVASRKTHLSRSLRPSSPILTGDPRRFPQPRMQGVPCIHDRDSLVD